ncbi:MAG TPA: arabinofuranosidase catalytic domain-containing protein [Polyangiaceae bacterium]|nr:arabinofuranosidase catalytic domain-containing protein [Polyangiaceae bacterium]
MINVRHAALALSTAICCISSGCSNSSGHSFGPGNGGSTNGTGGKTAGNAGGSQTGAGGSSSGGTGSGTTCNPAGVTACGGSLVGTWTVASSCISVSGAVDAQKQFGLSCPTGQLTASLSVSGTFSTKADGSFVDGTTTTGPAQLTLPAECLFLSGTTTTCERIGQVIQGYTGLKCVDAAGGGCSCSGTLNQQGSMGVPTQAPNADGFLMTADNTATITQDNSQYSYCVSGSTLTVTPKSTLPVIGGTIVLQGSSSTGTGGAPGSGGGSGVAGNPSSSGGASGGSSGGQPGTGGAGSVTTGERPCDIYAAANVPCGAAYSMVRSLYSKYTGPLYQVRNGSSSTNTGTGGMTKDILQTSDGYADTAAQDAFCSGTVCTVSILYDQSGNKNNLTRGSAGPTGNGTRSGENDYESSATKGAVTAGGHKVYSLYMNQYEGYRTALNVKATGVPMGNKDQGIYELADGTHFGTACCWDFGSVSPDPKTYVTMNTLFFGKGFWDKGAGDTGPWFMGDFEGGVWAGGSAAKADQQNNMNPAMGFPFALGILHTPVGKYALRMANIATATDLTTAYDGAIPSGKTWGNAGGITLGVGGDNSNNSWGTFYEGALTNGSPSNATDLLIMKNIQAVGYKK